MLRDRERATEKSADRMRAYIAAATQREIDALSGLEGEVLALSTRVVADRAEIERLRSVIRTGGAAYRLERAAMGIPGGIDADGQPIVKAEGSEP